MNDANGTSVPSRREDSDERSPTIIAHQSVEYSGPLPPPQILAQYEQIVPGSARRMVDQWEAASVHERNLESGALKTVQHTQKWAPVFRLVTVAIIISGGLLAVLLGEPSIGFFLGLGAALGYPAAAALTQFLRRRDRSSQAENSRDFGA